MADTDSPLAQVDHLLQQREQYEQWLARLDGTGAKAPDAVRQKVRSDYQGRLDAVLVELRSHASAVEMALSGHNEALASLEARQTDIQERLAEAEIRHAVGEYTDDEWGAVGAEAEAALEEMGRRIGVEQGEITRLSAVLKKPRLRMMTWRSSAVSLLDFHSSMSFCIGTSVGIQWFAQPFR